jgi:hypothetical protein
MYTKAMIAAGKSSAVRMIFAIFDPIYSFIYFILSKMPDKVRKYIYEMQYIL